MQVPHDQPLRTNTLIRPSVMLNKVQIMIQVDLHEEHQAKVEQLRATEERQAQRIG